jgi:hypothetical protein
VSAETSSQAPDHGVTARARAVWRWWKGVARRIGDVQARIMLNLFYFVILAPFALVLRRKDPLAIRSGAPRGWRSREGAARPVVEQAHRQS